MISIPVCCGRSSSTSTISTAATGARRAVRTPRQVDYGFPPICLPAAGSYSVDADRGSGLGRAMPSRSAPGTGGGDTDNSLATRRSELVG
jgi:hypothetical protein